LLSLSQILSPLILLEHLRSTPFQGGVNKNFYYNYLKLLLLYCYHFSLILNRLLAPLYSRWTSLSWCFSCRAATPRFLSAMHWAVSNTSEFSRTYVKRQKKASLRLRCFSASFADRYTFTPRVRYRDAFVMSLRCDRITFAMWSLALSLFRNAQS
jgi:hypothetical protein